MIQVVLEVYTSAASFRVTGPARSIRRAISVAGGRYPNAEVGLVLPVEPESIFVGGVPSEAEFVAPQVPERLLADSPGRSDSMDVSTVRGRGFSGRPLRT